MEQNFFQTLPEEELNLRMHPSSGRQAVFRINALIMSLVTMILVITALAINIQENNTTLYIPLTAVACIVVAAFFISFYTKNSLFSMIMTCATLIALGFYLIFGYAHSTDATLFWFLLYPPMIMLCLGLFYGTIIFSLLFIGILLSFLGPLSPYLVIDYPLPMRVRFLTVFLGAWMFSWFLEYTRHRAQRELNAAMIRLEREALTDSLTNLGNRRDFYNFFSWIQAKARREKKHFCLAMIDIDLFKTVNDRYGHDVGDAVLQHTARILSSRLRAGSRLFRWGGEEFIALMPETNEQEAVIAAERLRRSMEESPYIGSGLRIPYTVSIGMHCGPIDEPVGDQINIADAMLYQAKNSGRNRVEGHCSTVEGNAANICPISPV